MLRLNINNKGSLISCTLGFVIPLAKLLAVLYALWLGEKESLYKTLYSCEKLCTGHGSVACRSTCSSKN